MLSAGGASGPTRLILAGSAIAIALNSLTMLLMLLFEQETVGFSRGATARWCRATSTRSRRLAPRHRARRCSAAWCWAAGSTSSPSATTPPRCSACTCGAPGCIGTVLAVLLSTAAVTLAGPVGFVGLCAPVIVRLARALSCPALHRHRLLMPLSGRRRRRHRARLRHPAARPCLGAQAGVDVPDRRGHHRCSARSCWSGWPAVTATPARPGAPPTGHLATVRSRALRRGRHRRRGRPGSGGRRSSGMLAGDTWLLTGDVVNWLHGPHRPGDHVRARPAVPARARRAARRGRAGGRRHHGAGGVPQPAGRARDPRRHRRCRASARSR